MSTRVVFPAALIAATVALHGDASNGRSPEQATSAKYDLLLRGGHVIDAKNSISAVRDVAIADGKIAAVAAADRSGGGAEDRRRRRPLRHARPGRHPRARLRRHRRAAFVRRRQQRLSRRLHVPRRRHDRGGRGLLRLAQLRRFQGPHHRSLEDPRPRVPEHRRQRHARRQVRAEPRGHGGGADRRDGEEASGTDRRDQDRALRGPGVDAGRARRRGRARWRTSR